jgi:hypothetical protein
LGMIGSIQRASDGSPTLGFVISINY